MTPPPPPLLQEVSALFNSVTGSVAELGNISRDSAKLFSALQSAKDMRQLVSQDFLPQVRDRPESLIASWARPELINDANYVHSDDPLSTAIALKSLIPESVLSPDVALSADAFSMILFLLQDEHPAIASQLAKEQAKIDNPALKKIISVLLPKKARQTSSTGMHWYRLLLSSPIPILNRLVDQLVAALGDPSQLFQQRLERALDALRPLQDAGWLQGCIERLMAKEREEHEARMRSITQQLLQTQQQNHQLVEGERRMRQRQGSLEAENKQLREVIELLRVGSSSSSSASSSSTPLFNGTREAFIQQSRAIQIIQAELDKLKKSKTPEEFGDDF